MNWELFLGLWSIIVALGAIQIATRQADIMRKHNRLSVKPHLNVHPNIDTTDNRFSVDLTNYGLGPL